MGHFLDEPSHASLVLTGNLGHLKYRICSRAYLVVPVVMLPRDKAGSPVNEKKYRPRYRLPTTLIVRESSFLPLPILPGQSVCNVRSRRVWIVVQEPRVQNIRSWGILQ
jgi:hypothetical protein